MTHMYGNVHHPCKWYNPDGLHVSAPDNIDQWNFRGGKDYWSAQSTNEVDANACGIDPLNCYPVSEWGLGEGDGLIYCDGDFLGNIDGSSWTTWLLLAVGVIAVVSIV